MTLLEPFRIMITGAAGIIGSPIADVLTSLSGSLQGRPVELVRVSRRTGLDLFQAADDATAGRIKPLDVIIHAAATPYEPGKHSDYEILTNDFRLTHAALHIAHAQPVLPRFIYLSSSMIYEKAPSTAHDRPRPLVETDVEENPAPEGPIALSKMMSECAVRAWSKSTGGTHTIWRLSNVIAPHEPHDQPGHVVTDLYRKLFVDRVPELRLAGGGFQVRAFSWFEDVVGGIVNYMLDPATDNQTFNMGSDRPTAIAEVARVMAEVGVHTGLIPGSYRPVIVFDSGGRRDDVRVPSIDKARTKLGWEPTTTLPKMLELFLRAKHSETAGATS